MDGTPDYSKCSLRELRDVAARIDKAKYGDRYKLVLREIERRETLGDDTATAKRQQRPIEIWDNLPNPVYLIAGAVMGAFLGIVWLSMTSVEMSPDSPDGIAEITIAAILGAVVAKIGVTIMHRTKRNYED